MNTRRDLTMALLGLPLVANAATLLPKSETEAPAEAAPEKKAVSKPVPLPFSEAAASIISYTIYAEARGEPWEGKMAVAAVIKTRATRSRISPAEVCLQYRQFTCWNDLNAVPDAYISGEGIQPDDMQARMKCYGIAWALMISDRDWDHLTHFYNPKQVTPAWASELKGVRTIGDHTFGYID